MSQSGVPGPQRDIPPPPAMPSGEALADLGPPAWPKVVGITDIVLGSVSILCMGCGVVGVLMPVFFLQAMEQQFPDGMPPSMAAPSPLMFVSFGLGVIIDIFLIVCGILLLLRLPTARTVHLVYGVVGLIGFVVGMAINLQHQTAIAQWINQNPDTKFAQQQQATGIYGEISGWAIGILFGAVWPLFCLIWFGAAKKKHSDMTGEEAAPSA